MIGEGESQWNLNRARSAEALTLGLDGGFLCLAKRQQNLLGAIVADA